MEDNKFIVYAMGISILILSYVLVCFSALIS